MYLTNDFFIFFYGKERFPDRLFHFPQWRFFFSFFDVFFLYFFSSLKKHRFFVVVDVFFLSIFQNIVFIFRKTDQSIDLSLAQKSHSKNLVSWLDRHFIDKCLINENPFSLLFYFRFHGGEITAGVVKLNRRKT